MTSPKIKSQDRPRRTKRSTFRSRMRNFLMFLPNMVKLIGRLMKDKRVPMAEKALFTAAVAYVILPFDFIPDFFPFFGQVDDVYLVALTLLRLINKTDVQVVRQSWTGGGDVVALIESVAALAPTFLPQRIVRMLSAKVEMVPGRKVIDTLAAGDKALVYEVKENGPTEKAGREHRVN